LVGTNPKTQRKGLLFPTHIHTKQKQKEQSKFKIQKTILREPKKGKKENQEETTEIKWKITKLQKKKKKKKKKKKI